MPPNQVKLIRFVIPVIIALTALVALWYMSTQPSPPVRTPEVNLTSTSLATLDDPICPVDSSTDVGEILFTVQRYGSCTIDSFGCVSRVELCTINANGTGLRQVALLPTDMGNLAWSPDRQQITYYLFENDTDYVGSPLYVKGIHDAEAIPLVESFFPGTLLSWSPDGAYIAYATFSLDSSLINIFTVTTDGTNKTRQIGQTNLNATSFSSVAWSNDGAKLAVEALTIQDLANGVGRLDSEIFIMNADGSERHQLTDNEWDDCCASWTPDGQTLVFLTKNQGQNLSSLFRVDLPSLNPQLFFPNPLPILNSPTWSSDGRMAVIESSGSSGNIFVFDPDMNDFVPLVRNGFYNHTLVWSPHGQQLLFLSRQHVILNNNPGGNILYIVNADGTGLTRLTSFPEGISVDHPTWGRTLLGN